MFAVDEMEEPEELREGDAKNPEEDEYGGFPGSHFRNYICN